MAAVKIVPTRWTRSSSLVHAGPSNLDRKPQSEVEARTTMSNPNCEACGMPMRERTFDEGLLSAIADLITHNDLIYHSSRLARLQVLRVTCGIARQACSLVG